MQVVIIAGGKGTRIASVNSEIPKAMIPVDGKPVLEHQIVMAARYGYKDIILLTGHLGEVIADYFGDGSKWGVNITYYREQQPLGTAGALAEVKDLLDETFFVFYGDTVMDIDMPYMMEYHKSHNADATLLVHPNDHPYDSDIIKVASGEDMRVTEFCCKPHPEGFVSHNIVNAALFIFNKNVVDFIPKGEKSHIEKHILPKCLEAGLTLYAYRTHEYVKDMGTPERYNAVCGDWISGRVRRMNRENKTKAVFLDRDGVINLDNGLVYKPEQLVLVDGIEKALGKIHAAGYLAIVITNQSVIARNLCSFEEHDVIEQTLETLLGKKGAYIDALYFCPHHPDSGYPEEIKELKIKCDCRKPAPGLLLKAAEDFNIDLAESFMIGDRKSDVEAGNNAKVKGSFLCESNNGESLMNIIDNIL